MITPETELMMSNLQHGCCKKRSLAMDGLSTLVTFTLLTMLKIKCDPRGAVGFQGAVGGSRPLVAIANAIKPRIEVFNPFPITEPCN